MYVHICQFLHPQRIDIKSSPPPNSTSDASLPVVCGHCGPHSEGPESGGAESVGGTIFLDASKEIFGIKDVLVFLYWEQVSGRRFFEKGWDFF